MVAKPSSALHSNVYELSSSKNPYGSKTDKNVDQTNFCYLLAKIHMVAKPCYSTNSRIKSYLLAKIHMVAKLLIVFTAPTFSYLLAKIHMVAKPRAIYL